MSDRLTNLTSNISDILEPIRSIHGQRYHDILMTLFCIGANLTQLDDMLCESTALIRNLAATDNNQSLLEAATVKHNAGHDIAHAGTLGINGLISILESEYNLPDLHKNFSSLLHRIEVDFRNPPHTLG
jgi:hypothetical protein